MNELKCANRYNYIHDYKLKGAERNECRPIRDMSKAEANNKRSENAWENQHF